MRVESASGIRGARYGVEAESYKQSAARMYGGTEQVAERAWRREHTRAAVTMVHPITVAPKQCGSGGVGIWWYREGGEVA